jgi:hypothetical protein
MDHQRKKVGQCTSSILVRTKQDQVPQITYNLLSEPLPEEDHRLANWRRWLQEHQRHQKRLVANLKREPLELALNAQEHSRSKKETQCLIAAASKSESTSQTNYPDDSLEPYELGTMTPYEKSGKQNKDIFVNNISRNPTSEITRVSLPNYIRKEKNLLESHINTQKAQCNFIFLDYI